MAPRKAAKKGPSNPKASADSSGDDLPSTLKKPPESSSSSSSEEEEEETIPAVQRPKFVALSSSSSGSDLSSSSDSGSSSGSSSSLSSSSDSSSDDSDDEKAPPKASPKAAAAAAAKSAAAKKGKKSPQADDDLDKLLEEIEAPSPPKAAAKAAAAKPKAKAKAAPKSKGKKGAAADDDEDIDALLRELEGESPAAGTPPAAATPAAEAAGEPAAAAGAAAAAESAAAASPSEKSVSPAAATGEGKLSRAAQRRQKKKQKQQQGKDGSSSDEDKPQASLATPVAVSLCLCFFLSSCLCLSLSILYLSPWLNPCFPGPHQPAAASAKKGPVSAAVRAAQQRLQLLQEQQRRQQEEEERQRREEEELRKKEEEEERQRAAEREARARRRAEKKEKLKEEGKLLSAKEQKLLKKRQQYLQQLQQQGLAPVSPAAAADAAAAGSSSKVVEDRAKKKKERERRALLQQQQEAAQAEAERQRLLKLQEELNSLAQPASPTPQDEDSAVDDWESLLKEEESAAPAAAGGTAAAAAAAAAAGGGEKKKAANVGDVRRRAAMEQAIQEAKEERLAAAKETAATTAAAAEGGAAAAAGGKGSGAAEGEASPARPGAAQAAAAQPKAGETALRSPICCILGHVDTGKTKLLDRIRRTNVQLGEAGGITQQIGATFFPKDALLEQCNKINPGGGLRLPGLLVIDTPGHASFSNLRARGSSLCDLAIVVVDVMHGLEPQTRESLSLLRQKKCPFVVALNKIDRLYGWQAVEWGSKMQERIQAQNDAVRAEFQARWQEAHLQLTEEGFNCSLYWENPDVRRYVSVVPTSAHTGEGIADLIHLICTLNETLMRKTITKVPCIFDVTDPSAPQAQTEKEHLGRKLQCTILEVKAIEGLGTTIDVILVQGVLYEGDRLVCCGLHGPIVTTIRALLTPQPLKELRVKGEYISHHYVQASMGVKIAAPGLEEAVAGTSVFVVEDDSQLAEIEEEVMTDIGSVFKNVDHSGNGVYVMASTLGALEALLVYLQECKIPVFAVNIGSVQKRDVRKASIMREKGRPELSVILAFNVKVDAEAEKEAKVLGVRIMTAEIIYHLFDEFTAYFNQVKQEKKSVNSLRTHQPLQQQQQQQQQEQQLNQRLQEKQRGEETPCCCFCCCCFAAFAAALAAAANFSLIDVNVVCDLRIGTVVSVELNRKPVDKAVAGTEVCIKVVGEPSIMVGRHFEPKNKLVSRLTRNAIDCLKEHFRDELSKQQQQKLLLQEQQQQQNLLHQQQQVLCCLKEASPSLHLSLRMCVSSARQEGCSTS
ncbi:hypothetical protein Emed_004311 [Eimeria media]